MLHVRLRFAEHEPLPALLLYLIKLAHDVLPALRFRVGNDNDVRELGLVRGAEMVLKPLEALFEGLLGECRHIEDLCSDQVEGGEEKEERGAYVVLNLVPA